MRDLFGMFSLNSNRVRKFTICSMLVQFWSHSTCYSPVLNDDHSSLGYFKMRNVMSPPTCILSHYMQPSHYSRSSGHDCCILPFIDVKVKEGIEHVSDKKEEGGMEDDKGSYKTSMHGSTLTTLNVLITLWTLIWASIFLLCFHLCPKLRFLKIPQWLHQFIYQTYMNSRNIVYSMLDTCNVLAF